MANKIQKLANVSQFSWFIATALMIVSWFRIVAYAFSHLHYVIEDQFIYIGVLGGWLFIEIWFTAILIFIGWYVIRLIGIIANDVNVSGDEQ